MSFYVKRVVFLIKNKFISLFLIFFIVLLHIDYQKKEAHAILPVAIGVYEAVAYVATAMVAGGAVGYYTKDADGNYGGNLYTKASETYSAMSTTMQDKLKSALTLAKVAGYMATSQVPGLWDFLHGKFTSADSMVPNISGSLTVSDFSPLVSIVYSFGNKSTATQTGSGYVDVNAKRSGYTDLLLRHYFNFVMVNHMITSINYTTSDVNKIPNESSLVLQFGKITAIGMSRVLPSYGFSVLSLGQGTGTWSGPASPTFNLPTTVNDVPANLPITIPAEPTQLNQATVTSQLTSTGGTVTTPKTSDDAIETGKNNELGLAAAAAAAAAAAYAAAIAAGLSPSAASAAATAASDAIKTGLTAEQAATIAASTATTYADAPITDVVIPILDKVTVPLPTTPLKLSMSRLISMNKGVGEPPRITIPLNQMINCFEVYTGIHSPFSQDNYVLVDFGILSTLKYGGISVMDYMRNIIGFGMILTTFMYCYRKIYNGQVI